MDLLLPTDKAPKIPSQEAEETEYLLAPQVLCGGSLFFISRELSWAGYPPVQLTSLGSNRRKSGCKLSLGH